MIDRPQHNLCITSLLPDADVLLIQEQPMGLLSKVASRFQSRRDESDVAGPSTSPAGFSGSQDERAPNSYASHVDDELLAEAWNRDDADLPSYDQLFQVEPASDPWSQAREKRKDPRRRPPRPRLLPDSVLDLLCSYLCKDSPHLLPRLALLDKAAYDTVVPHLYHTVPIERNTIQKLLYGIPIPVQGFVFDPDYDGKGKRKEGRNRAAVSPESEERKRRCLSYTKRVLVDSVLPDWTTCRSLSVLRNPEERKFVDTSDNAPDLQYHPMRRPVADSEKRSSRTGLLMPNAEVVIIRPEAIQALVGWERMDKSIHLLPQALASICQRTTIEIHGSVMDLVLARFTPDPIERSRLEVLVRKTIERFATPASASAPHAKVKKLIWYGVTTDPIPYISNCEIEIHFSTLVSSADMELDPDDAVAMRIDQIRHALSLGEYYVSDHPKWHFVAPGLLLEELDEDQVHSQISEAILHQPRSSTAKGVSRGIKLYTLKEAIAEGLVTQ